MRARPDAVRLDGVPIGERPAYDIAARGIALVPEGRRLFASLSVEENLLIGGQLQRPGPWTLRRVYDLFPVLAERAQMPSTALSGGQQQMVALGRALMSNSRLILCDEISLGLAPIVVRDIYAQLPRSWRRQLARHRGAGHRAGPQGCRPSLLPAGRPRRPAGRRARPHPASHRGRLFRSVRFFAHLPLQGGGRIRVASGGGSRDKHRICREAGPPPGAFGATLPLAGGGKNGV